MSLVRDALSSKGIVPISVCAHRSPPTPRSRVKEEFEVSEENLEEKGSIDFHNLITSSAASARSDLAIAAVATVSALLAKFVNLPLLILDPCPSCAGGFRSTHHINLGVSSNRTT